jgi:hypothetical protein
MRRLGPRQPPGADGNARPGTGTTLIAAEMAGLCLDQARQKGFRASSGWTPRAAAVPAAGGGQ